MHAAQCRLPCEHIINSTAGHEEDVAGEDAVVVVSLDFLEAALGKPQHALEVNCMALGLCIKF